MKGKAGGLVATLILIFIIPIAAIFVNCDMRLPNDASLVAMFHQYKPELEQMRAMLDEDSEIRMISRTHIEMSDGNGLYQLSNMPSMMKERLCAYKSLMRRSRVLAVARAGNELRFLIRSTKYAPKGWRIAFALREQPPDRIVGELDNLRRTESGQQFYRHIEDGWYIWLHW